MMVSPSILNTQTQVLLLHSPVMFKQAKGVFFTFLQDHPIRHMKREMSYEVL